MISTGLCKTSIQLKTTTTKLDLKNRRDDLFIIIIKGILCLRGFVQSGPVDHVIQNGFKGRNVVFAIYRLLYTLIIY